MSKFTERSTAPVENTTIINQLSHRTFRRFTDERLTEEQVDTLVEVARRTATSSLSMNLFICAAEDAVLAAQNTVTAAESMGLGTVFLGSILGDPRRVIAAMELPELTYPILGLLVGHSEQEPLYRPRLPRDVVFARNTYPRVDSFRQTLAEYGKEVSEYYEARGGSAQFDDFGQLVVASLGTGGAHVSPVLETLHEQGLCLF